MELFQLTSDYIELSNLLKCSGPCVSGGEAKHLIINGQVLVNGSVERRKKCKIKAGQTVVCGQYEIQVILKRADLQGQPEA